MTLLSFTMMLVVLLALVAGCGPADGGFRFHGEYEAALSGYDVQILSKGFVEAGHDVARTAYAIVQVCPTGRANGRSIRMILQSVPGRSIEVEAEELGPVFMEWNSKTSEGLLRGLLSAANFRNIRPDELHGSVRVIEQSLAGPKGAVLKGQIESLRVLRADIENGYPVERETPPREWLSHSELPACATDRPAGATPR